MPQSNTERNALPNIRVVLASAMQAGMPLPADANVTAIIKKATEAVFPKPVKITAFKPMMTPAKTAPLLPRTTASAVITAKAAAVLISIIAALLPTLTAGTEPPAAANMPNASARIYTAGETAVATSIVPKILVLQQNIR